MFEITEPLVRKLLATVDAGLVKGLGRPEPGKMCVEAAISYALGEPHSDGPSCVDPIVRTAKIALNDASWSSPAARAMGMRRVAIAQLGSKDMIDSNKFVTLFAKFVIREIVPLALRAAAKLNPVYSTPLEVAARRCAEDGTKSAVRAAARAAVRAAARAAVRAAVRAAAYAAADAAHAAAHAANAARAAVRAADAADAARAAVRAADAADAANAADAAHAAARAAAHAAADAAADAAANAARAAVRAADTAMSAERDKILSLCASLMVRALHECGSPGCAWLWIVDESEVK